MGETAFEHASVPYGDDGKLVRGVIARCGAPGCREAARIPVNQQQGVSGPDADAVEHRWVTRKLEAKGWRIGKTAATNRCPGCLKAEKFSAPINKPKDKEAPMLQVVNNEPREMTREEYRLVFAKLHEVYLDEVRGYADDWTDERVAVDLGVPRIWVKDIREDRFGAERSNDDIRKTITEANELLVRIVAQRNELQSLFNLADKIEKHLGEIGKVLK